MDKSNKAQLPPQPPRHVGDNIRRHRLLKGMSQRELAQKAGVSHTAVARAERGVHHPHPSTMRKLAMALEVSVEALFHGL